MVDFSMAYASFTGPARSALINCIERKEKIIENIIKSDREKR